MPPMVRLAIRSPGRHNHEDHFRSRNDHWHRDLRTRIRIRIRIRKIIDRDTDNTRIKGRRDYEMRYGKPDADGDVRVACPAASTSGGKFRAKATCKEKRGSLRPQGPEDHRPKMFPVFVAGAVPKVCRQATSPSTSTHTPSTSRTSRSRESAGSASRARTGR